jgi:hypothetical protein
MEMVIIYIKEIDWKEAVLDNLYIFIRKKKAVQAFSEAYIKRATTYSYNNIIIGKGQGFSILLQLISNSCRCCDSTSILYKQTTWYKKDLNN